MNLFRIRRVLSNKEALFISIIKKIIVVGQGRKAIFESLWKF